MDIVRKVLAVLPKSADLKYHVSLIETEHGPFLDFREYVTSLDEYGRGVTLPADNWEYITTSIEAAMREREGGSGDGAGTDVDNSVSFV